MAEQSRPAKRVKYGFQKVIRVSVGPGYAESQIFEVHADLLINRSSYFKTATEKFWLLRQGSQVVYLRKVKPEVFKNYLQFLYQGMIDFAAPHELSFLNLVDLYILADMLGDLRAANESIDQLIRASDRWQEVPKCAAVARAFDQTSEASPLRRLMIDFYIFGGDNRAYGELDESMPPAFTLAFMKRYRELKNGPSNLVHETFCVTLSELPECTYHRHDETHPSCEEIEVESEAAEDTAQQSEATEQAQKSPSPQPGSSDEIEQEGSG